MELDFEEEREKEKDSMQLEIDGMILEIPEELLNMMEEVLLFESRKQLINEITITIGALKKCFSEEDLKEKSFQDRAIEYLQDEVKFYQ